MATIPTDAPSVDSTGLMGGNGVMVQKNVVAVMNNAPIFGVGSNDLKGYVSVKMYDQVSASIINGSAASQGTYDLFQGQSYSSGKPYVTAEASFAMNVNMAT